MIRRLLFKMRYFRGICGFSTIKEIWYNTYLNIFFFQARLNAPSLANLRNIPSTDGNYRATRHEFWIYSLGEKRWSWLHHMDCGGFTTRLFLVWISLLFCFSLTCSDFTGKKFNINLTNIFKKFIHRYIIYLAFNNYIVKGKWKWRHSYIT